MKIEQPDSASPQPPGKLDTAINIYAGLTLTVLLHLIQVAIFLVLPLSGKAKFLPFFFGFFQVLYILPAILYCQWRNKSGLVIGLVIGASITFIIGLPIAGTAYECSTRDPNAPLW